MRLRFLVSVVLIVGSLMMGEPAWAPHEPEVDFLSCDNFATQEAAQAQFAVLEGFTPGDSNHLDEDGDGIACENLPSIGDVPTPDSGATPDPGATTTTSPPVVVQQSCHPSYVGACIPPNVVDVDCPGGSGDGPSFAESANFTVVGPDVYDLDRDNDGIACESSGADAVGDAITAAGATPPPAVRPPIATRAPLARTGQASSRMAQVALVVVLFGAALVIAPRVFCVPKKRMD